MHARSIIEIFRLHFAAVCTTKRERWFLKDDVWTSNTMSTGFSAIMQSIDLSVAWKGQIDSRLLLAEDSIPVWVFSLIPPLFLFVLSDRRGWTEPSLFLVFWLPLWPGKVGSTRIKAHRVSWRSHLKSHHAPPLDRQIRATRTTKWNSSWVLHLSSFQFCYSQ